MMTKQRIDVFISSTSIDLPEHRAAVRDAILTLGLFPSGMEHWPVSGENPVDLCHKMVNEAEIYLGIYAHRYGWRPDGYDGKSITELEYEWAGEVRRDGKPIPRLCFIMADSHPWPKDKMELDALDDLNRFKQRVKADQIGFYTTSEDLKAQVALALAPYAQREGYRAALPYLRWLHEQSKQSGLLRVLRPRDASAEARPITVDQVYTSLDTRMMVTRDKAGRLLPSHEIEELKRSGKKDNDIQQTPLTVMEAANLFPHLVLLGDPGSGKSTFLNYLALCLTGQAIEADDGWLKRVEDQGWEHGEKLPVVVTLRDFAQDIPSGVTAGAARLLFEHVERQLSRWKLEEALPVIRQALDEGRALVLLDGLDEVPPDKRDLVRDTIADFMARCHSDNRIMVTCRILSYANPDWRIPAMVEETLAPFDEEKVKHFIEAWYTALKALHQIDDETAAQRVADLPAGLQHLHLQDISSNPMLLTVMAIVHNHTGTLPRESAKLYQQCVELLMLRWKPQEARSLLEMLDVREDDLYRMLWEIAYDAHAKQAEREGAADISEADIIAIAASHLNRDMGKAQLFCDYVEQRAGLLVGRGVPGRWRVFTFPHRTFQEYLSGCYIANNSFWEFAPDLAQREVGWREVLMLATGHLVFNQGRVDIPLLAIDEITPAEEAPQDESDWRATCRAGDMLTLVGVQQVVNTKKGPRILTRLRTRLAELVSQGHLTVIERAAAGRTLAVLGDPRPGVGLSDNELPEIEWVDIPAGLVVMRINWFAPDSDDDEQQVREVLLPPYRISRYPITYVQFQAFLDAPDGFYNLQWWQGIAVTEQERNAPGEQEFKFSNHPRERVSWNDAIAFCRWLSEKLGYEVTLPTDAQWEKAARGPESRIYPYGNEYDISKANTFATGIHSTSAVGIFPDGASPYGVLDMSGNVFEWCLNEYDMPDKIQLYGTDPRTVRGGSFGSIDYDSRAFYRTESDPSHRSDIIGFRLVAYPPSQ